MPATQVMNIFGRKIRMADEGGIGTGGRLRGTVLSMKINTKKDER
jgi:hypothetical protein